MTGDPVDGAFRLAMIVAAAVTGGCISFWLAAEWMNLDDRELTGDRFPYLVMTVATGVGGLVLGGLALAALLLLD